MRVILAHGIGLGSWLWERWLPLFPAEWAVEALQMPGHRPESPDTTLAEMAAAIRAAVRAGPGPAAVVGHSASGLAAGQSGVLVHEVGAHAQRMHNASAALGSPPC